MSEHSDSDVPLTEWLQQAQAGEAGAAERAWGALYPELRKIARARLRVHQTLTLLNTDALVHESFLRFVGAAPVHLTSRKHFYAYAAKAMRHIVVDFVRREHAQRRGGGWQRVTLDTDAVRRLPQEHGVDVLDLAQALDALEALDPALAELVELRCFGGYTDAECAQALEMSERSVRRHWDKARAFLLLQMGGA